MAKKHRVHSTTHTVHFQVHANGNIDYIPGLLHTRQGDKIKWTCNQNDFFISFKDRTPLDDTSYLGVGGVIDPQPVTTTDTGVFHYQLGAVVELTKRGKKIKKLFMTTDCPELDIP